MKLLFDQNLSFKLCAKLADLFPGSEQVRQSGLDRAGDAAIWQHAKANGFVIVSQDADFSELATLLGPPPKVIWLRCGNLPTKDIEKRLRDHAQAISAFDTDTSAACLEIF
jgi:predicted nuclease of predicted toxin-antitoxin system